MSVLYSRHTPFGFIDPATAKDEDMFYGETVTLSSSAAEKAALAKAGKLRKLFRDAETIQKTGFDSASQAIEMAEVLKNG